MKRIFTPRSPRQTTAYTGRSTGHTVGPLLDEPLHASQPERMSGHGLLRPMAAGSRLETLWNGNDREARRRRARWELSESELSDEAGGRSDCGSSTNENSGQHVPTEDAGASVGSPQERRLRERVENPKRGVAQSPGGRRGPRLRFAEPTVPVVAPEQQTARAGEGHHVHVAIAVSIGRQHGSQACTGEQLRPRLARKADTEPGR